MYQFMGQGNSWSLKLRYCEGYLESITGSNAILRGITGVQPVDVYVRLSLWKWLGQVFKKEGVIACGTSGWQVQGKRGRGRPKVTWLRTTMREGVEECWSNLVMLARDRWWWPEFTEAL